MQKLSCLFIFILLSLLGFGQESALKVFRETPGLKNASIGISVKRLDGRGVLDYNAGISMQPASLVKLFTTGLALEKYGADFSYTTRVYYSGEVISGVLKGNIVINTGGDPTPDSRFFPEHSLLRKLREEILHAGIKEIDGSIVIEGRERQKSIPGSWLWEDISNYYAALYNRFNYRDNTYWLEFSTGRAGTPAQLVQVEPEIPGVKFQNEVTASRQRGDNAWIFGGPYTDHYCISGTLPENRKSFKIKGAMHHPEDCFLLELTELLGEDNILVRNNPTTELSDKIWFELNSPTLKEIVYYTNKQSINLFSEALGALFTTPSYDDRLKEVLVLMGADPCGISLKDACGLSAFSALPSEVITDYLSWAYQHAGDAFMASLPVVGHDNGLNAYCRNNPLLKEKLRAKTGSFSGVRCLAGYLTTAKNETLVFTVMVNQFTCPSAQVCNAVGRFLEELVR